jgi:hypothetical protein
MRNVGAKRRIGKGHEHGGIPFLYHDFSWRIEGEENKTQYFENSHPLLLDRHCYPLKLLLIIGKLSDITPSLDSTSLLLLSPVQNQTPNRLKDAYLRFLQPLPKPFPQVSKHHLPNVQNNNARQTTTAHKLP